MVGCEIPAAERPAAYLCVAGASRADAAELRRHAVAEATARRGWPEPAVYLDENDPGQAGGLSPTLTKLVGEISAGKHDALLVACVGAISAGVGCLVPHLLYPCMDHGVPVEFLTAPAVTASTHPGRPSPRRGSDDHAPA